MASTAPKTTSRPSADCTRAGFTLLELLTVLLLLSVLLGIGVGMFKKLSLGRSLAVSQVKDALRQARLFAIEQSAGASVEVDAANQRITASGFVLAGNWHFEDETSRGWPTTARLDAGIVIGEGGAIGKAAYLPAQPRGSIDLGHVPSFDADQGFAASLFVKPDGDHGGTLLSKGNVFTLAIGDGQRPRAHVRVVTNEDVGEDAVEVESPSPLAADRWSLLEVRYDGRTLSLSVDGRLLAETRSQGVALPRIDPDASLRVGSMKDGFAGGIDEVRFAAVVANDSPPLPEGVRLAASGTVHFDGRGRLDSAWHARPVSIDLLYEDDKRTRSVTVGLLGEIQ